MSHSNEYLPPSRFLCGDVRYIIIQPSHARQLTRVFRSSTVQRTDPRHPKGYKRRGVYTPSLHLCLIPSSTPLTHHQDLNTVIYLYAAFNPQGATQFGGVWRDPSYAWGDWRSYRQAGVDTSTALLPPPPNPLPSPASGVEGGPSVKDAPWIPNVAAAHSLRMSPIYFFSGL